MQVFLVRHADAIVGALPAAPTRSLRDPRDAERYLTIAGRIAARAIGDRLRWYDCRATVLWTSPAMRAVQTVEHIAAALGWSGLVEGVAALAPGGDLAAVQQRLVQQPADAVVVLVGHEPELSRLGAWLTGSSSFPALRPAEAARIDGDELRWLFAATDDAPRSLRALSAVG